MMLTLMLLYFLPFLIAMVRRKRNAGPIGLLNLFLGWTVLGWIGALIWACLYEGPERVATVPVETPLAARPGLTTAQLVLMLIAAGLVGAVLF